MYRTFAQQTAQASLQVGKDDEKLQQTVQLTKQRLSMFAKVHLYTPIDNALITQIGVSTITLFLEQRTDFF